MTAGGSFGLAPGGERGVIAWDAQFQRTVTHATFRDRQTDDTFTVFSVHLDHDGSTAREKSAQLLTGRIPANPCVFAGDYNCVPESDPYKQLTVPLTDTRKAAIHRDGPQETYVGFDTGDDSGPEGGKQQSRVGNDADSRQLDYLFTRGFSVVRHRVNVPDGLSSDHRPVMVDLIVE
jgi:Metal-dependent hydrolase